MTPGIETWIIAAAAIVVGIVAAAYGVWWARSVRPVFVGLAFSAVIIAAILGVAYFANIPVFITATYALAPAVIIGILLWATWATMKGSAE